MRVALAQINTCVGDLEGNVERCLAAVETSRSQGADLVVLPELAVPGPPPRDILFDPSFVEASSAATADLAHRVRAGPPTAVGTLMQAGRRTLTHPGLFNAAVLISGGEVHMMAAKRTLPAHDVFFEPRWFLPGPPASPTAVAGKRVGFLLSHDLEAELAAHETRGIEGVEIAPVAELLAAGAQLLVCLAASPYLQGILGHRRALARCHRGPLVYVNLCGANDELIFDGRSFAVNERGGLIAQLPAFEEQVRVIDLEGDASPALPDLEPEEELYRALVLGVRDFARKNRLERAFLGLSGGVDSALVATIATEALGPDRVTAIAIPSRYTDPRSTASARELSEALGMRFEVVDLEHLHAAAEATRGDLLEGGTTAENVQARLRAMILMSFVNHHGGFLLNTSNKTELALGYATIYGDAAGTLCPIADLTKLQVVALARWINRARRVIPRFTLERPPTAELRPGQVDPFDYANVAPEVERLVQENCSDFALRQSEHKRWQMGVILKVSRKSFGTGRLIPITRR